MSWLIAEYTDGGQIYESVVYNKTAQEFIIKNMEQILNYDNENRELVEEVLNFCWEKCNK